MLEIILPILLQLSAAPDDFYQSEFSAEASAVVEQRDALDEQEIVAALEALAERGDDSALEVLGEIYNFGLFDIARDARRGCDYFDRVDGRRADALHNLATCYFNGDGRPQDFAKARELYVAAAEAGFAMSFCAYGNMLVRGEGGPVDAAEGIRLCRMTAVAGDADAQTDYGTYLLKGQGIERDPVTARFMLEQAALQEQRNAAYLLGQIHTRGDGTPVDHIAASEWFEKAYEWGREEAAYQAARSYMRRGYIQTEGGGATVSPDLLEQAKMWLNRALEVEQPASERYLEIEQLIVATDSLIAAARASTER